MEEWKNLKELDDSYKNIINNYFENKTGTYLLKDNILYVNIDDWGIEKFYINGYTKNNKYYNIHYEFTKKIYDIAISIQIGNWSVFKMMEKYLDNFNKINANYYFIMIDTFAETSNINYLKEKYKTSVILSTKNKGMDIGLFLLNIHYIKYNKLNHEYIIKLHTKTNDNFRNECLNSLIGSEQRIINNFKLISKNSIGMISGNIIYKYTEHRDAFNDNYYYLEEIIKYLYNETVNNNILEFVAGTMFIVKLKAFSILNIYNINYLYDYLNDENTLDYYWYSKFYNMNINDKTKISNDYYQNMLSKYPNNIAYSIKTNRPGLRDCMVEHAIERLFGYLCKKSNLSIVK